MLRPLFCIAILIGFVSCKTGTKDFLVSEVNFLTNVAAATDSTVKLSVDLEEAVLNGITIPTKNQTKNGYFNFNFKVKNQSEKAQQYFYKVYYQNESYKFEDRDSLAGENFYGSWEEKKTIFKATKTIEPGQELIITDSFRIVGNPRNEKVFFGSNPYRFLVNDESLRGTIDYIKKTPEWIGKLPEKAAKNKIPLEEQLYLEALWSINNQKQRDSSSNNRWKRNPRMGMYGFMLVVTTPEHFDNISPYVKDLSQKNGYGKFINPFAYYRNDSTDLTNTSVSMGNKKLLVRASVDFSKGIYINPLSSKNSNYSKKYFNADCSDSMNSYKNAQIELFFHNLNRDYELHNIPSVKDVTGDNYTRKEYEEEMKKYAGSDKLINGYVNVTDCPCKNLSLDKNDNSIRLKNPGNKPGEFKKEHVGLSTRIGFTYGKFRAKIKFPEMISKDNVWNGITNAFWMIAQDIDATWNMRRACGGSWYGYLPKNTVDSQEAEQFGKKRLSYSEIDFEIIKESAFWPKSSYANSNAKYKTDDPYNEHNIMVTCTNWDMACTEPKKFSIGATLDTLDGAPYLLHRWSTWNKALTTKIPAEHDELFKAPYYYFEIEWMPDKITWRIGPEKNKMRIICVMDKTVTAIPDNQMVMVVTQEWHNQEWWPTAPFKQNFIPFPKNDIIGKVLELEIE